MTSWELLLLYYLLVSLELINYMLLFISTLQEILMMRMMVR